jgi:hypothetical protein
VSTSVTITREGIAVSVTMVIRHQEITALAAQILTNVLLIMDNVNTSVSTHQAATNVLVMKVMS